MPGEVERNLGAGDIHHHGIGKSHWGWHVSDQSLPGRWDPIIHRLDGMKGTGLILLL